MKNLDTETLWTIFEFIGTNWGNAQFCAMPKDQFIEVVNWQVNLNSVYSNYYSTAVVQYQGLLAAYGGNQQLALKALFQQNQLPNLNPDVGTHVLYEFMCWQVLSGGFRAFGGYVNYTGWMGGGSYLNNPPPYRSLPL